MIKKFHITTETRAEFFVDSLYKIRNEMEEVFNQLVDNNIPNETYTAEDLKNYCKSLVNGQREVNGLNGYSWCLTPNIKKMQSDSRFDFINLPSIIATATLMKVRLEYPVISKAIPGFDDALHKGLLFSSLRMHGHGYEWLSGLVKSFGIFSKSGIFSFLDENPEFCTVAVENLNRYRVNLLDTLLISGELHYEIDENSINTIGPVIFNKAVIEQHLENIDNFRALTGFTLRLFRFFPDSISEYFKETIFNKIEKLSVSLLSEIINVNECLEIVRELFNISGNKVYDELSVKFLERAIELSTSKIDFESIEKFLKYGLCFSPSLLMKLYEKQEQLLKTSLELGRLAHRVHCNLKDDEYARVLYQKALDAAVSNDDKLKLINRIRGELKDKVWANKIQKEIDF